MEASTIAPRQLFETFKGYARLLLQLGENRLKLLMVEVQEEREHLLHAVMLALGVAAFGLLGGLAISGLIVILLWEVSPVAALLMLSTIYGGIAIYLYQRLCRLLLHWQSIPATLEQLRKDRTCLEKILT